MGLMRTPPTNTHQLNNLLNQIAPSPTPTQQKQQQPEHHHHHHHQKRTISQEIDPFKKKPKLTRSPPSSIPILSNRFPKTPQVHKQIRKEEQHQQTHLHQEDNQVNQEPHEEEQNEEEREDQKQDDEKQDDEKQDEEKQDNEQEEQEPVIPPQDEHVLPNPPTHPAKDISPPTATTKPTPTETSQNITNQSHQEPPPSPQPVPPTTTPTPPIALPQPIQPQLSKTNIAQQALPKELPQDLPQHASRRKSSHTLPQTVKQATKPTENLTKQAIMPQLPPTAIQTFTSRKSFTTDYDTSRESNATSLSPNVLFMEHRIEELQDLVNILQTEKLMNELERELEESQRAWDRQWDGSREKDLDRIRLEEQIRSTQSASNVREMELALNSLDLKNMENQLSIKDYQCQELIETINQYQRQSHSRDQVLSGELERLRIINAEWAQVGQNFESLMEIERREKEELQGRFEVELRQTQLEPSFEINTLKYQLVKAENRAERLEEQLSEVVEQSKTFQAELITQSALKDKLARDLELSECRIKSLSDQIVDLNNSLSQLHKGEESNQRTLLQDLLAARSALAEKELEIINLQARFPVPSQPSSSTQLPPQLDLQRQPLPKRGRKKAQDKEQTHDGEKDEALQDPVRLITSNSWVSIGAVAKKVSRSRVARSNASTTGSVTRDTEFESSSKKGVANDDSLEQHDADKPMKKRNQKVSKSKQAVVNSTENTRQSGDQSIPQNNEPVISPGILNQPSTKKKSRADKPEQLTTIPKKNVEQIDDTVHEDERPAVEPEGEIGQDAGVPEQPITNLRTKKRVGKGKAKQITPDQEEEEEETAPVGATTEEQESNVEARVETPVKSTRPVRGKQAKKTAKQVVINNNEEEDNERAAITSKRQSKKPVGVQVAIPRGRRKAGTVGPSAGAAEDGVESDLIVTTNEEDEDGGDPEILAIAEERHDEDHDDDDDDDSGHVDAPPIEEQDPEPIPEKGPSKGKKASGAAKKNGKQSAAVPPNDHSPLPSPSIPTPPSPSPASGKKKSNVKKGGRTRPTKKAAQQTNDNDDDDEPDDADESEKKDEADAVVEEEPVVPKPTRGKPRAKKAASKAAKNQPRKEPAQEEAEPVPAVGPEPPVVVPDPRPRHEQKKRKSSPTPILPPHPDPERDTDADATAVEETFNKKKRKIFHSKKPALTWASSRDDENNMLGLPPELSPIKQKASGSRISGLLPGPKRAKKAANILPLSLLK